MEAAPGSPLLTRSLPVQIWRNVRALDLEAQPVRAEGRPPGREPADPVPRSLHGFRLPLGDSVRDGRHGGAGAETLARERGMCRTADAASNAAAGGRGKRLVTLLRPQHGQGSSAGYGSRQSAVGSGSTLLDYGRKPATTARLLLCRHKASWFYYY